jgi:hypothetical protein
MYKRTRNVLVLLIVLLAMGCTRKSGDPTGGGGSTIGSKSSWTPAAGNLAGGIWRDPASAPDPTHQGAYGGIAYAPNGDLYLFYDTGTAPNEVLKNVIRRNNSTSWSSEFGVDTRLRTAHLYFSASGTLYLCTESGGSVFLYTSTSFSSLSVTWNLSNYFQANDGNPDLVTTFGNAFMTADGSNLNLFYSYLYYNAVVGAEEYGLQYQLQSGAAWPPNGAYGKNMDTTGLVNYQFYPHGVEGAFQDTQGNILALSSHAYRSTNHGSSFTKILSGGAPELSLDGVSGSSQNPTDKSIILGNFYHKNGQLNQPWLFAIWGSKDYGATMTNLNTVPGGGSPYRARIVATQNLIVAAFTIDGGGLTWSSPTELVDATSGGQAGYTLGSVELTANSSNGHVALAYTLLHGATFEGAYVKEFY